MPWVRALALSLLAGSLLAAEVEIPLSAGEAAEQAAKSGAGQLVQQALAQDDLEKARASFVLARNQDAEGPAGARAGLELGRMDYAMQRFETALLALDQVEESQLEEPQRPELLYYRGQSRLVLKGVARARADLARLVKEWPKHALAASARLGVADCDAALGQDASALAVYMSVANTPGGEGAPLALWQAAALKARRQRPDEARELYQRLLREYPDSFEASAAKARLEALPAATQATPAPAALQAIRYSVQVGAFTKLSAAQAMVKSLKKLGFLARIEPSRRKDVYTLHLVRLGHYKTKSEANALGLKILKKARLRFMVVED